MVLYESTIKSLDSYIKERTDEATYAERNLRADNRRLSEDIKSKLLSEVRQSLSAYEAGRSRLQREKGEWFKHAMGKH